MSRRSRVVLPLPLRPTRPRRQLLSSVRFRPSNTFSALPG